MNIRHLQVRDLEPGEFFILGREVMHPRQLRVISHDRGRWPGSILCLDVQANQYVSLHKTAFAIRSTRQSRA